MDDLGAGPGGCGFHGAEVKLVSPGILSMWPRGGWDREELVSLCLSVRLPPGLCCLGSQASHPHYFSVLYLTSFSVAPEGPEPSDISLW